VREAVTQLGRTMDLVEIAPWNLEPAFVRSLATALDDAVAAVPHEASVAIVLSAHSLPERVVRAGDPYPQLVEATARAVIEATNRRVPWALAYQSQGMSTDAWLGPDLPCALRDARAHGATHVVVAPIGFVSDHVEILYDLDIEARELARSEGLSLSRTRTLNATPGLIDALESAIRAVLAR
jgi:ferrochelatase